MSQPRVFMMGEFAAPFPTDRKYARNHMWAWSENATATSGHPPGTVWRFGFAAYAVRLLQDVYFLDWNIDPDRALSEGEEIGAIESSKAESSLYAPMTGHLTVLNQTLMQDPSAINVDKYGAGWLFEMEGCGETLLSADEYVQHLAAVWEVTQKTIKGQLNQ
ncbi:MAG: glycine cleavage system protein H [Planctomycetales bacterium]|nr:glycine cleavage system protein H [Planctomycetales bacterium]NIP68939.1 glycine cleavage system protein H [Planctomycetales bacterium]